MVAPLLVESAASIRLIDDAWRATDFIGLVLQKKPEVENPTPSICAPRCAGASEDVEIPGNTVRLLVEGFAAVSRCTLTNARAFSAQKSKSSATWSNSRWKLTAMTRNAQRQFQENHRFSPSECRRSQVAPLNTEHPANGRPGRGEPQS